MRSLLLNFSGHPLNQHARNDLAQRFDRVIDAPIVEITFDDSIATQIERIVCGSKIRIDGSFSLTIIPPGQSTFAILLVSYLHGLIGHFPNICYLERSPEGLYMPRVEYQIQPHEIRGLGRKFRVEHHEV